MDHCPPHTQDSREGAAAPLLPCPRPGVSLALTLLWTLPLGRSLGTTEGLIPRSLSLRATGLFSHGSKCGAGCYHSGLGPSARTDAAWGGVAPQGHRASLLGSETLWSHPALPRPCGINARAWRGLTTAPCSHFLVSGFSSGAERAEEGLPNTPRGPLGPGQVGRDVAASQSPAPRPGGSPPGAGALSPGPGSCS